MNAVEVFEEWLENYLNFERQPKKSMLWLDTMDYLCKRFDNPQDSSPCFHVAGSKGKGSVSKMIACILDSAGYSVGLYSSPHICDFRERITTATDFFPEEIYEESVKEIVPKIESIIPDSLPGGRPLTWFEIVTLYAFLCFKKAKVDWSVYEVGLGGRLDSTNVIRPKICCITPIEMEHTEFLGDTLEKIAGEKAGIIKNFTPVIISSHQTEGVRKVFENVAKEHYAPLYFTDDLLDNLIWTFHPERGKMHVHMESPVLSRAIETDLQMPGEMQAFNAAMAVIAVKKVYPNLDEKKIEEGLSKAFLQGRFEFLNSTKKYPELKIIFDGAHTVNSISLTIKTLNSLYSDKKVNLLFACAADKDVKDIALLFQNRFNEIFVTVPGSKKEGNLNAENKAFCDAKLNFKIDSDYKKMICLSAQKSISDDAILLVTGSFYLVSEAKKLLT